MTSMSAMVAKIPPKTRTTKQKVKAALYCMLRQSMVFNTIKKHCLRTLRVVWQQPLKLGKAVDNSTLWLGRIENGETLHCNCHLYPDWFPRRHGHIFIPQSTSLQLDVPGGAQSQQYLQNCSQSACVANPTPAKLFVTCASK